MTNIMPALITLYGENDPRLGWIETIVVAAITNIIGDVSAVSAGREDTKTAILNTLFPYIGKIIGNAIWPVKGASPAPAPTIPAPTKLKDLPPEIQQIAAMVGSGIPFIGSLIYQVSKGYTV